MEIKHKLTNATLLEIDADTLQGADLQEAGLQGADLQRADLRGAGLQGADLQEADLRGADLQGADLRGADLRGADLDFSVWPLWCGSLECKIDKEIATQLLYHALSVGQEHYEGLVTQAWIDLANQFHRDCVPKLKLTVDS